MIDEPDGPSLAEALLVVGGVTGIALALWVIADAGVLGHAGTGVGAEFGYGHPSAVSSWHGVGC